MSDFSVNTKTLHNVSNDFNEISRQIQGIADEAKSILSKTRNSISIKLAQSNKTNAVFSSVSNCSADAKNLSSALRQAAEIYNKYEETVKNKEKLYLGEAQAGTGANSDAVNNSKFNIRDLFWKFIENAGVFGTAAAVASAGVGMLPPLKNFNISELIEKGKDTTEYLIDAIGDMKLYKNFHPSKGDVTSLWGKKLFGLEDFFKSNKLHVSKASDISTRWYNNFNKVKDAELGKMKGKGFAIGTAISFIANGFDNYQEHREGEISGGRAAVETFVETGVDLAVDTGLTIGVAAALGTVFGGAPVIAVAGCVWGITKLADWATDSLSGGKYDTFTEFVSDSLIDGAVNCYNKAKDGVKAAWKEIKSWF